MRLMRFNFTVVYVSGKNLVTADALSRAPLREKQALSTLLSVSEVTKFVEGRVASVIENSHLKKVKECQAEDDASKTLARFCRKG